MNFHILAQNVTSLTSLQLSPDIFLDLEYSCEIWIGLTKPQFLTWCRIFFLLRQDHLLAKLFQLTF